MKCLTICQPYPSLIFLPEFDPRHKRIENRQYWPFRYTGTLLIHAGKSREWLDDVDSFSDPNYGIPIEEMVFGAIVGVVHLAGVVRCYRADAFPRRHDIAGPGWKPIGTRKGLTA